MATSTTTAWSAALARSVSRAVALSFDPGATLDYESPSAALSSLAVAVLEVAEGRPVPPLTGEPWIGRVATLSRRLRQAILIERNAGVIGDAEALHLFEALDQVEASCASDVAARFAEELGSADAMDFLVEVAHDLRSPIGSVLLLVDRMRKGHAGPVTPVQERQLGLVYAAAFGLGALTGDIMELAKGGTKLRGKEPVLFSLNEVLQAVREMVAPISEEKGLTLTTSGARPDKRLGYPAALYRVLLNLATNALKFTDEGSVAISAEITGADDHIEFCVRDTGRGMPAAMLQGIRDVFHQREQAEARHFSSTGLGLAICQKLVAAMGGTLQVESSPDTGTMFCFTLQLPPAPRP